MGEWRRGLAEDIKPSAMGDMISPPVAIGPLNPLLLCNTFLLEASATGKLWAWCLLVWGQPLVRHPTPG